MEAFQSFRSDITYLRSQKDNRKSNYKEDNTNHAHGDAAKFEQSVRTSVNRVVLNGAAVGGRGGGPPEFRPAGS